MPLNLAVLALLTVGLCHRSQTLAQSAMSTGLAPGTFAGTFKNTFGHSGADELVVTEVQGSRVRGMWSSFPFDGSLSGQVLEFVVLNQVNRCRDYKVRITFAADWTSAASAYSVTDRCGPAYQGTQSLRRVGAPPPQRPAPDLNGSWAGGEVHIWQDGTQVLVTATWKRDGKYCIFRGEGQLSGRVTNLAIRYSPMTHGDRAQWRGVFTLSEDGNSIQAVYTLGAVTERRAYARDR